MVAVRRDILLLWGFVICYHLSEGNDGQLSSCSEFQAASIKEYLKGVPLSIQYHLFTPNNRSCSTAFSENATSDLLATVFNASLDTKVIIHGYSLQGHTPFWIKKMVTAILERADVNVLVVDWLPAASFLYANAVQNSLELSWSISSMISKLIKLGSTEKSFHLIGVSLGAHIAGFVGSLHKGRFGRITGLDPAHPRFQSVILYDGLNPSNAVFVDALHSDTDGFGINLPVGHVDYYLNGGKDQPGCSFFRNPKCDHIRAAYIFISAITKPCLQAFPCGNYEDFMKGNCRTCRNSLTDLCPRIGLLEPIRNTSLLEPERASYFLRTTATEPFCAHHILVEIHYENLKQKSEIEVTLISDGLSKSQENIKLMKEIPVLKRVMAHTTRLCEIMSVEVRILSSWFRNIKEVKIQKLCLSQLPSERKEETYCFENIDLQGKTQWSHEFITICD
ncbi:phospholipase A1 member A [Erpetoichthys calabaricus]|uniref:Phospholipase A1 member A n=1 Tax=Erpetoichthys calabaricus TaxID=27687 RepID=A0A8C4X6J3_ERPCA|nr:phospholipase A1 member A [Erpetoichthys calabaricus]